MMAPADFRLAFAEFDSVNYPDPQVQIYLNLGYGMLNENRWGSSLDYGVSLLTAHYLTIDRKDRTISSRGGVPGEIKGSVTSRAVDKISEGYSDSATIPGGSHWNMTSYGLRFLSLARLIGAGGLQIQGSIYES